GDPYHGGMKLLRRLGWTEKADTHLGQKFRAAGLVFVGRTNVPELGSLPTTEPDAYGPTRNPWDPTRSSGGSSGGAAAAVAAGLVPAAHANDGGGSIRIPASCCGLVGLKPSRGRTSLMPEFSVIDSLLIAELCVSRSVRDTAAVLDAVQGATVGDTVRAPAPTRPFADEVGADAGRLRIKLITQPTADSEIHPDCVEAARATARLLESLGHSVEEATWPAAIADPALLQRF